MRQRYSRKHSARPELRGTIMHNCVPVAMLLAFNSSKLCEYNTCPLSTFLRKCCLATIVLNVCVSDVYHNSDYLFGNKQFTFREESLCLRADFTVNAIMMASLHAYWFLVHYITFADAINDAWLCMNLCSCIICVLATWILLDTRHAVLGESVVKLALATQFLSMGMHFGYQNHDTLWWIYMPGMLAYATHAPRGDTWGAHEVLHNCVLMGHFYHLWLDWKTHSK
jgi:hypothetical protein